MASVFLIILATFLIISGTIGLVSAFIVSLNDGREEIVQAISYVVIAIAVFDVAKYFIEEEVLRPKEKQSLSEARISLTKFMTTIIIAVFIEGLVGVFERSGKAPVDILYPAALLIVATFMVIALEPFWKFAMIGFQEVLSVIQRQDVDASTTRPHGRNYTQDETLSV